MLTLLKTYFGFDNFRPLQEEIIDNILKQKDTLVLMPTGGGKSLCYQLPALKLNGLTLVISPLISLMKDQVDSLKTNGISAEFINSSLALPEIRDIEKKSLEGKIKILYLAPERLASSGFQTFLKKLNVGLIAIDEAHCISEWGHDFRPDYRNLKAIRQSFPAIPVVALTATATPKVREDIINQLELQKAKVFISSFNRPNLNYFVRPKRRTFENLVSILQKYKDQPVIIYCFSRKETENIASDLREIGFDARAYHAGLPSEKRQKVQEKFIRDKIQIIVATIAFGMGIDKPDVRLVVHYSLPKTIEGYYQETGRAGRDGLSSDCILFYSYGDTVKHNFFINQIRDHTEKSNIQKKLQQMVDYCEQKTCRRNYLLSYFGEGSLLEEKSNCQGCDVCLTPREDFDATEIAQKILSAILKTDERFGLTHIINVLKGSHNKRVLEWGHDKLSVYGISNKVSSDELKYVIDLLVGEGLLGRSADSYKTLYVASKGRIFLKQKEKLTLKKPHFEDEITTEVKKKGALDYDEVLFAKLRSLRRELADDLRVPPFMVFGDTALQQMSFYFPQSTDSFRRISGVGEGKLERFGKVFIDLISSYAKENNLEEKIIAAPRTFEKKIKPANGRSLKRRGSTYSITRELLLQKKTIEEIANLRQIAPGTVINHIEKFFNSGETLNLSHIALPPDRLEKIQEAFQKTNQWNLWPVKNLLGEEFSYDEIRLARIFLTQK